MRRFLKKILIIICGKLVITVTFSEKLCEIWTQSIFGSSTPMEKVIAKHFCFSTIRFRNLHVVEMCHTEYYLIGSSFTKSWVIWWAEGAIWFWSYHQKSITRVNYWQKTHTDLSVSCCPSKRCQSCLIHSINISSCGKKPLFTTYGQILEVLWTRLWPRAGGRDKSYWYI